MTKKNKVQNFNTSKEESRKDEFICSLIVKELLPDHEVIEVGADTDYKHLGDIIARKDGKDIFFEVKTDNVFAGKTGTQNAFAEEKVTFFNPNETKTIDGYMFFDYSIVFLHSRRTSEIVVIDYDRWKYAYRKHMLCPSEITINHYDFNPPSKSVGVMNPLGNMEMEGVIIGWLSYDWSGKYFGSPDCKAWIVDTQENPKYHETDDIWNERLNGSKKAA